VKELGLGIGVGVEAGLVVSLLLLQLLSIIAPKKDIPVNKTILFINFFIFFNFKVIGVQFLFI